MSSVENSSYPASPTFYFLSSNPEYLYSDEDIEHPKSADVQRGRDLFEKSVITHGTFNYRLSPASGLVVLPLSCLLA